MNRTIAIILATLALLSAGSWGWSRSDLWPKGWQAPGPDSAPDISAPDIMAETAPEPAESTTPDAAPPQAAPEVAEADTPPESQETTAAVPAEPVPTPAPRDAALPAETGTPQAQETERAAEAAIAAADARARAEAEARAEREALAAARAELDAALAPLLNAAAFSPAGLRAAMDGLPDPATPLIGQTRAALTARISDVLDDAESALSTDSAAPDTDAQPDAPAFDPAPYIARIREVL